MPPAASDAAAPDKLSLLVLSGDFERVHYALVLASAAAAIGMPATLFFTDRASFALAAGRPDSPGWRSLAGEGGRPGGVIDDERRARGVAGFEELLGACAKPSKAGAANGSTTPQRAKVIRVWPASQG